MKFSILCLTLFVASAVASDFKLVEEEALLGLIKKRPEMFLEAVPTEDIEEALRSLVEKEETQDFGLLEKDGSVNSTLDAAKSSKLTLNLKQAGKPNQTTVVTRDGSANVQAKCSRKGMVDSAHMVGNCTRTTTVASAHKSLKVRKDIKFHVLVTVIRLGGRRQSEILAAAKEHDLLEEVNAILAENGGHCPSLSIVIMASNANETVNGQKIQQHSGHNLRRKLRGALMVAHIPKKALNVRGKVVKTICKHCEHEESDLECNCHPLVITNKIDYSVMA